LIAGYLWVTETVLYLFPPATLATFLAYPIRFNHTLPREEKKQSPYKCGVLKRGKAPDFHGVFKRGGAPLSCFPLSFETS